MTAEMEVRRLVLQKRDCKGDLMSEADTIATKKDRVIIVIDDLTAAVGYIDLCLLATAGTIDLRLNIIAAPKFECAWPVENPRREKEYWKPKFERCKR